MGLNDVHKLIFIHYTQWGNFYFCRCFLHHLFLFLTIILHRKCDIVFSEISLLYFHFNIFSIFLNYKFLMCGSGDYRGRHFASNWCFTQVRQATVGLAMWSIVRVVRIIRSRFSDTSVTIQGSPITSLQFDMHSYLRPFLLYYHSSSDSFLSFLYECWLEITSPPYAEEFSPCRSGRTNLCEIAHEACNNLPL